MLESSNSFPWPLRLTIGSPLDDRDHFVLFRATRPLRKVAPRPPSYALVRTSLIATLLAAPLAFGAVQEWAWGAMAVVAFLLLLFWSIAGVRQGGLKILWSPLYLPAGFFFLLGMIQFAGHLTMDPIATREALLKLSTDLILFFLAGQFFNALASASEPLAEKWASGRHGLAAGEREATFCPLPLLRWTLVVYTFLLALFAIFQFFSSQGLIYWMVKSPGWTFGPYVNHNHYAGLMEMLIPLSVASALPALRKQPSAAVVGLRHSDPDRVAAAFGFARRLYFPAGGGPAGRGAGFLVWTPARAQSHGSGGGGCDPCRRAAVLLDGAAPHCRALGDDGGQHTSSRKWNWATGGSSARDSLGIFRDHPWLGAGLGSFETAFPRYQSFPSDFLWDHAHNDYAEALAETGLAGGAAHLVRTRIVLLAGLPEPARAAPAPRRMDAVRRRPGLLRPARP